jgi:hypothetical protein
MIVRFNKAFFFQFTVYKNSIKLNKYNYFLITYRIN